MNDHDDRHRRTEPADEAVPPRFASDRFYAALASRARRRTLHHLLDQGECTVEELATVLAGWDAVGREEATTTYGRRDRELELVHVHLPMLADADLVEYERGDVAVEPADVEPPVRDLIERSLAAEST